MITTQFSSRAMKMESSDLAALFELTERLEILSFAGGFPDSSWFLEEFKEITEKIISDQKGIALNYGPTPGISDLREFIAERLSRQGIKSIDACNLIITSGSLQGLDIVGRLFLNPGDKVIIEAPTYVGAIAALEALEADLVQVPCDKDGMRTNVLAETIAHLEKRNQTPKLIYTIPNFQNPSGCTLSIERRKELLAIATRYQIPVIEDNAYSELRITGEQLPMLSALDEDRSVIHLGTFSKIVSPGLRVGWLSARPEIIEKALLIKQCVDQCSNTLGQMIILEYGRKGLIEQQIAVSIKDLVKKRKATLIALEKYLPKGSTWSIPEGGFYTWVTLPDGADAVSALKTAIEKYKVAFVAGPAFFADHSGSNKLRICFSQPKVEQIDFGIKQIVKAFTA